MTGKDEEAIKSLPGDLKRVAELIGLRAALVLVDHFGGGYIIIPKCERLVRGIRNNKIRRLYDTGGYTIRELAWMFKLSDRTIKSVLGEVCTEIHPLLFSVSDKRG